MEKLDKYFDFYEENPHEDEEPDEVVEIPLTRSEKMDEKLSAEKQELVDSIIKLMEKNNLSFQKMWRDSKTPFNPLTDKKYKGSNNLRLITSALTQNFNDPRWMTFNQAKEKGYKIKKGAKSTSIYYYRYMDRLIKKPFDVKVIENLKEEEKEEYKKKNVYSLLKKYNVFNAEQIEGIEKYQENTIDISKRNEILEKVLSNSAAPIYYDKSEEAYYDLREDTIHLPKKENFKNIESLYSVALHEMAHSTGHESRLNRDMTGVFGNKSYAKEELIAEFASIFISQETRIKTDIKDFENNAAYLKSWGSLLKESPEILFEAIKEAQKVNDYIIGPYREELKTIENEKEKNINSERMNTNLSNINLKDLLEYLGEAVVPHGRKHYRLRDHDSLVISGSLYVWNSRNTKGNFYSLLNEMYGHSGKEAHEIAKKFLDDIKNEKYKPSETIAYTQIKRNTENKIPIRKEDYKRIEEYLVDKRKIDPKVVKILHKNNYLFLDEKNNINFVIKDIKGKTKGYDLVGTTETRFKRNTSQGFGFTIKNTEDKKVNNLYIFESSIDLVSYLEMKGKKINERHNKEGVRFLSLSGVREDILENYLDADIKNMYVCTDNDEAGNSFYKMIEEKYKNLEIYRELPERKDWNEDLQAIKEKIINEEEEDGKKKFVQIKRVDFRSKRELHQELEI